MNEQEIFAEALEQDADRRGAFLDGVCGANSALRQRVENLLEIHNQAGAFFEKPAAEIVDFASALPITETTGAIIGPYKLLEQIGEGGFGVVYLAEQERPVRRRVALKIIKPGMDTQKVLARFKAERQALALMEHSNIAKVLDAGATEAGRPYFVMELVRGIPITDYCDENKLPVHERLKLFVTVCLAVQHAHQKGIIHRDIKPSNVLVTLHDGQPVPKLIDFGVAKAINQPLTEETLFTRFKELIGTPLYMSPEQAEMTSLDIDTRSDVYSLGVLLYELVTGSTPLHKDHLKKFAYDEICRMIREDEPPKASLRISTLGDTRIAVAAHRQVDPQRLSQLVRGDLDWILMKALEKNRGHRYETVNNFAADVSRYLGDQPVEARPPSSTYRFRKFARRNRVALTTATLVLISLLLGTVASVTQAIRATHAEQLAESRLRTEVGARQAEEAQRQIAERERFEATLQRDSARRQLYVSQMNLALRAWDQNNVGRAIELLTSQIPGHASNVDLRGWEWHYLWRLCHSELRALKFLSLCLAISPDGAFLVSGDDEGTIKMWNADGTREMHAIKAHVGRINALAISRRGDVLATAGADGAVKLWEASTGREIRSFPGYRTTHKEGLALSPDGKRLAIASDVIKIWDTSSGSEMQTLTGHTNEIPTLAFSPHGEELASGSWDNTVRLWDVATGHEIWNFGPQSHHIGALDFSPDGQTLASASWDGMIKYWNTKTGRESRAFKGHDNKINRLVFSQDGTRIVSCSNDNTVKLWDFATGSAIQTLRGHGDTINDVAISPTQDIVASGAWDSTIRFWDNASRQEPWLLKHPDPVISVAFSRDGKWLALGSGLYITVWDLLTGQKVWMEKEVLASLYADTSAINAAGNCLLFHPESKILAAGLADGTVQFRDTLDGGLLRVIEAHASAVMSLDFSPDGQILATASFDRTIALWNVSDGRRLTILKGHTDAVRNIAFSPDGKRLASAGGAGDRMVRLWDVATGQQIRRFVGHEGAIQSVVFSRDGRRFFAAGRDKMMRAWDVESGQSIQTYRGHAGSVNCLSLDPDGSRMASCGEDQTVKIWDISTGQELMTLKPNAGDVNCVAFSPDGGQLVAGCYANLASVWDAQNMTPGLRKQLAAKLQNATQLRPEGDAFAWFALAIVKWKSGDKDRARHWYDKATEWMDKSAPKDEKLNRYRSEAEELLGLKETPDSRTKQEGHPEQ